jgi:hypothetical protein
MVKDELEKVWGEVVIAYYPDTYPDVLREPQNVRIAGVPPEMRTDHLPKSNLQSYDYTTMLDYSTILR